MGNHRHNKLREALEEWLVSLTWVVSSGRTVLCVVMMHLARDRVGTTGRARPGAATGPRDCRQSDPSTHLVLLPGPRLSTTTSLRTTQGLMLSGQGGHCVSPWWAQTPRVLTDQILVSAVWALQLLRKPEGVPVTVRHFSRPVHALRQLGKPEDASIAVLFLKSPVRSDRWENQSSQSPKLDRG